VYCKETTYFSPSRSSAGLYRGDDKFLARPGRKQAQKHVRDARDFNNIEVRAVIKFFSLQGKAPKESHAILTETLACFLPGWAKNLSVPLYIKTYNAIKNLNLHTYIYIYIREKSERVYM